MSESTTRQELTYLVDITRGANENWPPHITQSRPTPGAPRLTRWHVARVRVRVRVTMEVVGDQVRARFRSRGVVITRGWRLRADGTHGAPIGSGHYWRPREGNTGGWAKVRHLEADAMHEAAKLYRETFMADWADGAPEPWVDAEPFTRTEAEEVAERYLDDAGGPHGESGQMARQPGIVFVQPGSTGSR